MRNEFERLFLEDVRDKKSVSHSACKKRMHCGKGGAVRLPSDKLTKKELEKMNGKCYSYQFNKPIGWYEFCSMPEEHQMTYIKRLRERYGVPDRRIAQMMNVSPATFSIKMRNLGISPEPRPKDFSWDRDGWYLFLNGIEAHTTEPLREHSDEDVAFITEQTDRLDVPQITHYDESLTQMPFKEDQPVPLFEEDSTSDCVERESENRGGKPLIPVIPRSGAMDFEGSFEDILKSIEVMLSNGSGKISLVWMLSK